MVRKEVQENIDFLHSKNFCCQEFAIEVCVCTVLVKGSIPHGSHFEKKDNLRYYVTVFNYQSYEAN